jgi:hypothetical protein
MAYICHTTVIWNSVKLQVLSGHKTYSVTLREEHRLRVFTHKVLRKIFGHKMDEVTGH